MAPGLLTGRRDCAVGAVRADAAPGAGTELVRRSGRAGQGVALPAAPGVRDVDPRVYAVHVSWAPAARPSRVVQAWAQALIGSGDCIGVLVLSVAVVGVPLNLAFPDAFSVGGCRRDGCRWCLWFCSP